MRRSLGIGIGSDPSRIVESVLRYPSPADIICYARPGSIGGESGSLQIVSDPDPGMRMIQDLVSGKLRAAVRGTLPSHETLHILKTSCHAEALERIVLLETPGGDRFFLTPVGIDEGWTVSQKVSLVEKGRRLTSRFGLGDQVGILSGGRLGDTGRYEVVDRTMADAELVARITGATHYEIRIEDAIRECGLIIAPDGISGNLIFRTLLFAGKGIAHGAPVVNVPVVFVDTSRVNPDYTHALILASTLSA